MAQDTNSLGWDTFVGIEHITTTVYDDVLIGNESGNAFNSGAGDDQLSGNGGRDLFTIGAGRKTIDGGSSYDTVQIAEVDSGAPYYRPRGVTLSLEKQGVWQSTAGMTLMLTGIENLAGWKGDDRLTGDSNANVLAGNAGDDALAGGAGNDMLAGDGLYTLGAYGSYGSGAITFTTTPRDIAGNDTLEGGLGDDRLYGGYGIDTASYAHATGSVRVDLNAKSASGADGNDVLSSIENITGSAHDDILLGNAISNRLDGGAGADLLNGGAGHDTYVVENAGDQVIESSASGGTDLVLASISYELSANVENLTLTGTGAIDGTGNSLNNLLTGNSAANLLTGQNGNDTYVVDNAGDRAVETSASGGVDTVQSSVSFILGAYVENLMLTGTAAIDGTGNSLNNRILGNASVNVLDGGAGADRMEGGYNGDTYIVDNSGDRVIESSGSPAGGIDLVRASVSHRLSANVENLTLTGTAAISAYGNTLANILVGNSAANSLDGGAGADRMSGGAGSDTYFVENAGDRVTEDSTPSGGVDSVRSTVSFRLGAFVENLTLMGTAAINATGNELANKLFGNSAANILNGGAGADIMKGGAGNDTYIVDSSGDRIGENAGGGTDTVKSSISFALGSELERLYLTGSADVHATGNALDNTLVGNDGDNRIDGGAGADMMKGGYGNDTYVVDNAGDRVSDSGSDLDDTVLSSITYHLGADIENLTLTGTAAINAYGNSGHNEIVGNDAANVIDGGFGVDRMSGGGGDDTYFVDDWTDQVIEAANGGTDTVNSSTSFVLGADVENLVLTGSADSQGLGNAGPNSITGTSGDNWLVGGGGNDVLTGGGGSDIFVFDAPLSASANVDQITDFSAAADAIYLNQAVFDAFSAYGVISADAFHLGVSAQDAEDRILYDQSTGRLYYDADGTGSAAKILFAELDAGLTLTNADFLIAS